ncbi:hypothetical protein CO661_11020 [Sinorhizobium fredii]|uniref:Propionyl-coenzyme A carboxylase alpha polypeptide n=1 Tax=Rhizobium fredii TaxID=380 RepID=A0A2A6LZL7_RHIFR|nr:hypothetical protein CO661_11020 [Sinorhizobium fredii]
MLRWCPSSPPLACRPSPPQGGRSDAARPVRMMRLPIPSRSTRARVRRESISPLVGEMAGRSEGGGRRH